MRAAALLPGSLALPGAQAARKAAHAVQLHPGLWLGHQFGRPADHTVPTGFAALDAELPGGGWPCRGLTEFLLPQLGLGEIRLLAPGLVATQQAGRLVMLFDPPAELSAPALAQLGLDVPELLLIQTRAPGPASSASANHRNSLWALEQALKSGHVGAVLAWLPPLLRTEHLRRLQLAAQAHDGPAFVLRPWCGHEARIHTHPTPAPLRLGLRPAGAGVMASPGTDALPGAEQLAIHLLKRRGPPRLQPLALNLPPVWSPTRAHAPGPAMNGEALPALRPATFVNFA